MGFDERTHGVLTALAREQDVAVAWVIRRAVADYVARQQAAAEPELPLRRSTRSAGPSL